MDRLHVSFTTAVVLLLLWISVILTLVIVALVGAFAYHLSGVAVGSIITVCGLIALLGSLARGWTVVDRENFELSEYNGKNYDTVKAPPVSATESIVTTV
ncbi:hypothetical protein Pmar_PMAR022880 [Perkinsus marinus ATCC 50983]|uniref:Uncharacterized protein n=1 Tax=Perkinsus marinus (strain ATCC 50983 / TXsc) TaxID=423536 RepID=C5LXT2_PERM5|nr:hypothetical protein Pmar_PMAR022880 [Perkinsus marinus ATCC 50983]EEQ98459.1 hypothetical protein Pmar_PMAR022880 [Perkinsus marinus ATCC 50983]|eukprot:XP_002765742.1 hypothetical protein Pmar_PMAR022880 [Perkinsus marinus ATCC 50983]